MKKLPVIAGCILLLLVAGSAFAQQEQAGQKPSPDSISEIKGKTKFFLIADEEYKTILKLLTKKNTGLQLAATQEEADFIVEFVSTQTDTAKIKTPLNGPRYIAGSTAGLFVYYMSGDKRVAVWQKEGYGTQFGIVPNPSGDAGMRMLATGLTTRFLKDLE
jgi:hypothetical protein